MKKVFNFLRSQELINYYPLIFTVVFIGVLFQYRLPDLESIFYDLRVKYDVGARFDDKFVIVTLDEESDEFLGETYPYTYSTYSKFIKRLISHNPKAISFFGVFSEPLSKVEQDSMTKLKRSIESYQSSGGIFRFATEVDSWGERVPPEDLRELGYSPAIINTDGTKFSKDDVSRRAILNISGEETLHFWLANEFRISNGEKPLKLNDIHGAYYVREADASFSMFRYYTSPIPLKGHLKTVAFHRVVVGNIPKEYFKDKIVLVGPSYISNTKDFVYTPYNKEDKHSSKMSLHAIIINAIMKDLTVYKIPLEISNALALIIAIFLSIVISRIQPAKGLTITLITIVSMFVISYLLFILFGYWLYVIHIMLTIFVVYYIWVPFRAIGEYQRRYAIQEETKILKRVENLKQNFISLMSHDLKTPVAKVAGVADNMKTLYGTQIPPEVYKGLDTIQDSTKELNNFITSILDLTKIESRNLTINKTSKDINKLVENIVKTRGYEAKDKSVTVETDLGPLYPIEMDVNLITRVLSNLIENAIKYSGENTTVNVKTWDDEEWVYVEVSDNGVGIPEDDLTNIFEKFYRVKNDASHSIKGSGLGLYLVKYFVELHGGTISATSVLGEGTTFLVKLINK